MEYHRVKVVVSGWLKSYLAKRMHQLFIKETSSSQLQIRYGAPQVLVFGPLLFLKYINELNEAVKHSTIHHFDEDDDDELFLWYG